MLSGITCPALLPCGLVAAGVALMDLYGRSLEQHEPGGLPVCVASCGDPGRKDIDPLEGKMEALTRSMETVTKRKRYQIE